MFLKVKSSFDRRQKRNRRKIFKRNLQNLPKFVVTRSNCNIYAQIFDFNKKRIIVCASTVEKSFSSHGKSKKNITCASKIGKEIAKRALAKGVSKVVFDRGPYKYHGRLKAVAESARESGLIF